MALSEGLHAITTVTVDKDVNLEELATKTKTTFTLGSKRYILRDLRLLVEAGIDILNFDFGQAGQDFHSDTIELIAEIMKEKPNKHVGLMMTTKGPSIKVGPLSETKLQVLKGQIIEITTDMDHVGDQDKIPCSYQDLPKTLERGNRVIVGGSIEMVVDDLLSESILVRVENEGFISEGDQIYLPGCVVNLPTLTKGDLDDIESWGLKRAIDFVCVSMVRTPECIKSVRSALGDAAHVKIVAKIQNQEGLDNFDKILHEADAIMICRSTLRLEIPAANLFLAQKMMIKKANIEGTPIWCEGELLPTMAPSAFEIADHSTSVLDGADCLAVSTDEEADLTLLPAAVENLRKLAISAETSMTPDGAFRQVQTAVMLKYEVMSAQEALAATAVNLAFDLKAIAIVVITEDGDYARLVAKYRPTCPIVGVTAADWAARQMSGCLRGVRSNLVESLEGSDAIIFEGIEYGRTNGIIASTGGAVVCLRRAGDAIEIIQS